MPRPTLFELAHVLQLPTTIESFQPILGVAIDSRDVQPGELFVALNGLKVDGHDYVAEAAQKGAIAAVVSKNFDQSGLSIPLLKVDNPLQAIQKVAAWQVGRTKAKVVAITGSLGKTSTKDFLYALLKTKYNTQATSGNQNSQVGMASSLLTNVVGDEEFLVVEMGMTAAGHIQKLVEIVPPDMALITQIALVHAENFDGIEEIAKAKAEIFSHPRTHTVVMSKDSPATALLESLAHCRTLTYSMQDTSADFYLQVQKEYLRFCENGIAMMLPFVSFLAPHIYLNCLAACSMAKLCGMSIDEIGACLSNLKLPEKRLEVIEKQGIKFVNDSYNAAEDSVKAALRFVQGQPCQGAKIAVIGQMRELGKFSERCHRAVGECALECVEKIFCLGVECEPIVTLWKQANRHVEWFLDFSELMQSLKNKLRANDLVLLKGSRSNGLWRVLEYF